MEQPLHILAIEDSQADFLLMERHLRQQGMSVQCVRIDRMADLEEAITRGGGTSSWRISRCHPWISTTVSPWSGPWPLRYP